MNQDFNSSMQQNNVTVPSQNPPYPNVALPSNGLVRSCGTLHVYSARSVSRQDIHDLFSAFGTVSVLNMSTRQGFTGIFADVGFGSEQLTRDALAAIRGGTLAGISLASAVENNVSVMKTNGQTAANATSAAAGSASKTVSQLLLTVLSNTGVQSHINNRLMKWRIKCDWSLSEETSSVVVSALLPPTNTDMSCAFAAGLIASIVKQQSVTLSPAERKLCQSPAVFAKQVQSWSMSSHCPGSVEMVLSHDNIVVACLAQEMVKMMRSLHGFLDTVSPRWTGSSGSSRSSTGAAKQHILSTASSSTAIRRASVDKTLDSSSSESVATAKWKHSQSSQQPTSTGTTSQVSLHQQVTVVASRAQQQQQATIISPRLQPATVVQKHHLSASSIETSSNLGAVPDRVSAAASTSASTSSLGQSSSASSLDATAVNIAADRICHSVNLGDALMPFAAILNADAVKATIEKNLKHPLMTHLLKQASHSDLMSQIAAKCDCLIAPAYDHVDFASAEKLLDGRAVKLSYGRVVKIAKVQGNISRQNVDVILKPVFRASDFAKLRQSFSQDKNAIATTDTAFLAEPGLLLCKHVLYALLEDTASTAVSSQNADSRFFQHCFEAIHLLDVKTMAVPVDALCSTKVVNGAVETLQAAAAEALGSLKSSTALKLKAIRFVTSLGRPTTKCLATAAKAKPSLIPTIQTIPCSLDSTNLQVTASSSLPVDQTVLRLANGVKVSLVQDAIANVDAEALVSSTLEEDEFPSGTDCRVTFGCYHSLQYEFLLLVALPACPRDDRMAEQIIKAKATACLESVCSLQSRSVAFPFIGVGGLGYPADVVARGLLAAADEWTRNGVVRRLKDIRLVVPTSDQTSMQAFQDVFRRHFSQISASSPASVPSGPMAAFKLGSVEVKIDQTKLDLSQEQLLFASSQSDAAFASEWLEALVRAMVGADRHCVVSAVVPIQKGTVEAITPSYLADLFYAACAKFEATSPKHLRTLRPYFENSKAGAAFAARMAYLAKLSQQSESELWPCMKMVFNAGRQLVPSKSTDSAVGRLKEFEAKLVKFGINNADHPCFNVDLTDYSTPQAPSDYVIYGKADSIAKAVGMLKDIQTPLTKGQARILRFDYIAKGFTQILSSPDKDFCITSMPGVTTAAAFTALICDALAELTISVNPSQLHKDVVWYLQTPDAAWHLFDQREAAALEHLSKAPNELKRDAHFASFDFGGPTVTVGSNIMPIRRKTDRIPIHWISSDEDVGHRMVALSAQSTEFADIHAILERSNTAARRVTQIHRIENRTLFRQYLIQKEKVTRSCPSGHLVERDLFHGTSKDHLDGICAEGFDRSRAGYSVGALFGNGSYFSTSFDYSCTRNYAREGHVLYCKVLVGESVRGSVGLTHLPYKPRYPGIKYDSAVNNLQSPSIFVIFADNNAYPAYLITIAT